MTQQTKERINERINKETSIKQTNKPGKHIFAVEGTELNHR